MITVYKNACDWKKINNVSAYIIIYFNPYIGISREASST